MFIFRDCRLDRRIYEKGLAETWYLHRGKLGCFSSCVLPSALGLSLFSSDALAQGVPPIPVASSDFSNLLSPEPSAGATSLQPSLQPSSVEYEPIRVGPWEISPSVFSGMAYNDNLHRGANDAVGAAAWRETPTLIAVNDGGIDKFTAYALGDSYSYFRHREDDTFNGRVGLADRWEIDRDLVLRVFADVSRQTDLGGVQNLFGGQNYGGAPNYDGAGGYGGPSFRPLHYFQYETGGSIVKSFDRLFIGASGTFTRQIYDDLGETPGPSISESFQNDDQRLITGRVGYFVGPDIYTFVDTSANQQSYHDAGLEGSRGYRVVGGLGAEPFSLFEGEIYAGYQKQYYADALGGAQGGAALGGRVSWLPTQYLTVGVDVEQALSTSIASSPTPVTGVSATRTAAAGLSVEYALSQTWSATARLNFAQVSFVDSSRIDDDATAEMTFAWKIRKNLNATLDYQITRMSSDYSNVGYTQNVVSVGLTYWQ